MISLEQYFKNEIRGDLIFLFVVLVIAAVDESFDDILLTLDDQVQVLTKASIMKCLKEKCSLEAN